MAGIGKMDFFEEEPQLPAEKGTRQYFEKVISKNLDLDKFMANIGFYQR